MDWGTLAHIPHPQMTLSHDIVEAHCSIRVNGSQLKSKKAQQEVGEICGTFRPQRSSSVKATEGEGESDPIKTKLSR